MNPSRRGFFGFLAGVAALPITAKLPAGEAYAVKGVTYSSSLSLQEIVSETLRMRGPTIAGDLMKSNALLARLFEDANVAA